MEGFNLCVATPEGIAFEGKVKRISSRGSEGRLSVLPGHVPCVTALKSGEFKAETLGGEDVKKAECSDGFLTFNGEKAIVFFRDFKWIN